MLNESGTIWRVRFHKEVDREMDQYGTSFDAAVELASEHVDVKGATFYSMCSSYIIEDDDENRVSISEQDVYDQR